LPTVGWRPPLPRAGARDRQAFPARVKRCGVPALADKGQGGGPTFSRFDCSGRMHPCAERRIPK
jgi:hypothetical protein